MMEGSASSKVRAAFDKAGGKRSPDAAKAAAHKAGKANDLSPHTVRSLLSRWISGSKPNGSGKKAAKAPKRQVRKAAPKRQAKKSARPVRVAKKASAEATA